MQPITKRRAAVRIAALVVGTAAFGATCGVAYAANQRDPGPVYETNSSGETYGTLAQATSSASEPDLISAMATNGEAGYVKKAELDEASGANVANPAEAMVWQAKADEAAARGQVISIPVYDKDGKTIIGEFTIDPGGGSAG